MYNVEWIQNSNHAFDNSDNVLGSVGAPVNIVG